MNETGGTTPKAPAPRIVISVVLVAVGIGCLAWYFFAQVVRPRVFPGFDQLPDNVVTLEEAGPLYPTDMLFYTSQRNDYKDGDMTLEIPRLGLECPVLDGTGEEALARGVGLYEVAQTPGNINENVSIAGHRDIAGQEFYAIDTIATGDRMYLNYGGKRYIYEYLYTEIVEANDWSLIYCRDFPALTLTSCDPIGVASHRIIVVAGLVEVVE